MPTDLKSLLAQQQAAATTPTTPPIQPTTPQDAPLTPEEQTRLAELRAKYEAPQPLRRRGTGDQYVEGLGETDPTMGKGADFVSRLGRGFAGTVASMPKGLAQLYEGTVGDGKMDDNLLYQLGEGIQKFGEQADINPEYSDQWQALLGQGLGSAGAFLLPGGVAAKAATKLGGAAAKAAGYGVPAGLGAMVGASEQVEDYERTTGGEPTGENERLRLALYGAAGGATEAIPFGLALGRGFGSISDDIIKGMAKSAAKGGAEVGKITAGQTAKKALGIATRGAFEEGSQEAFQEGLRNYVAKELEEYDKDRDLFEGLQESAAVGGGVGFIMNAALGTMGLRARVKAENLANKFEDGAEANKEKLRPVEGEEAPVEEQKAEEPTAEQPTKPSNYYNAGQKETRAKLTPQESINTAFTGLETMHRAIPTKPNAAKMPATLRRDLAVLSALPPEEQQKAAEGKSDSPAANKAAQTAESITEIQNTIKQAFESVQGTALSPAAKQTAVKRRAVKALQRMDYNVEGDTVQIPEVEQKDDLTPVQRAVDANLDVLESTYDQMRNIATLSLTEQNTLVDQYGAKLRSYAAALTRAGEAPNMTEGMKLAQQHAKDLGIYYADTRFDDHAGQATQQVEEEEALDIKLDKAFPINKGGQFKGFRKAGEYMAKQSEMETLRGLLIDRGLKASSMEQRGNQVKMYLVNAKKAETENGYNPFSVIEDKKEQLPGTIGMTGLPVATYRGIDIDDLIRLNTGYELLPEDQAEFEKKYGAEAAPAPADLTTTPEGDQFFGRAGEPLTVDPYDEFFQGGQPAPELVDETAEEFFGTQSAEEETATPPAPEPQPVTKVAPVTTQDDAVRQAETQRIRQINALFANTGPREINAMSGPELTQKIKEYIQDDVPHRLDARRSLLEMYHEIANGKIGYNPNASWAWLHPDSPEQAGEASTLTSEQVDKTRQQQTEAPPPTEEAPSALRDKDEEFFGNFPSEGATPQTKSGSNFVDAVTFGTSPLTHGEIHWVTRMLQMPEVYKGPRKEITKRAQEAGIVDVDGRLLIKNLTLEQRKSLYNHVTKTLPEEEAQADRLIASLASYLKEEKRQKVKDSLSVVEGTKEEVSTEPLHKGRLTEEQQKQVDAEADALAKEIRDLENDGTPYDDWEYSIMYEDSPLPTWAEETKDSYVEAWEDVYSALVTRQKIQARESEYETDGEYSIPPLSLDDALMLIKERVPADSAYGRLADIFQSLNLNTIIELSPPGSMVNKKTGGEAIGRYNAGEDRIQLSIRLKDFKARGLKVLMHEIAHSATVMSLYNNQEFVMEVNRIMNVARYVADKRGVRTHEQGNISMKDHNIRYGLTNEREFVAELFTNKQFQEFLRSINLKGDMVQRPSGRLNTLWHKFIEALGRALGIKTVNDANALSQALMVSEKLITDQYTKDRLLASFDRSLWDELKYNAKDRSNYKRAKDMIDLDTTDLKNIKAAGILAYNEMNKFVDYSQNADMIPQVTMSAQDKVKSTAFLNKVQGLAKNVGLNVYVTWDGSLNNLPSWVSSTGYDNTGTKAMVNLEAKDVVIMANNIPDFQSFKRNVFHEVYGHFGMESLFGEKAYNTFVQNLANSKSWKDEVTRFQAEQARIGEPLDRITATKELIARKAETGETPGLMKRVYTWVRHKFRKYGFLNDDITELDLAGYIARAAKQIEKGTLPQVNFSNPQVMNSFMSELFTGAIQRGTPTRLQRNTMTKVIDKLLTMNTNIDEYQSAYTKAAHKLYSNISEFSLFRKYSALKNLPFKEVYNYVRQIGLGGSSDYDQIANQIWTTLDTLEGDQRKNLYDYFTTKDARLPAGMTEEQNKAAEQAKDLILNLGKELNDQGYLGDATFKANEGKYLHQAYLAFMMDEGKASAFYGSGSRLSLQNYLKEKTLQDETAKQALGWIDDPVLLATQSIAMVGRDVALLRMLDGLSYTSSRMGGKMWVTPKVPGIATAWSGRHNLTKAQEAEGMEQGNPKKIDPFLALHQLKGLRNNVLNKSHPSKKPGLIAMYNNEERKIRDHIEAWGREHQYENLGDLDLNGYKFVESGKRNGAISGRWIRKEIYDDIRASYVAFAAEDPSTVEKLIGQYGALTNINRFWKNTKTVWNPPTHVRNFLGNFVNLDISTSTNVLKLGKMVEEELMTYLKAIANNQSLETMPYYWQVADRLGITETTFTAQEAKAILSKWKKLHHGGKVQDWLEDLPDHAPTRWLKNNMPHMSSRFQALADLMGSVYQGSETLFKVVKLRDTLERYENALGTKVQNIPDEARRLAIESMAVQDAQKWIFDYSAVPRSIRYLRNAPIGAPFISFAYLALPRMFEASMKHPVKMIKYGSMPFVMGTIAAHLGVFGDDGDDWETVKNKLPNYQREKYSVMPLLWKDENGNPVMTDMGYYVPFSPYVEAARSYTRKFITQEDPDMPILDPILDMGILTGPIPDALTAMKSGEDPFAKKPIIRPHGTTTEKIVDGLTYAWTTAAPTFLTEKGWAGKTLDVLFNDEDIYNPRTKERKESLGRATARLVGVTTNAPNLRDSRATNIRYMEYEISKIKGESTKAVRKARAAGKSRQEIADIRKKYAEKMRLYRHNLNTYRRESR